MSEPDTPEVTNPGPTASKTPAASETSDDTLRDSQFEEFYRGHAKRLVGFLIVQGASLADSAEIAQDTMTDLYRHWWTVNHPRAWVHRVASRAWIRRQLDRREALVDEPPETSPLLRNTDIEHWERMHDIVRGLARLPTRQRQILTWSLFDYSPAEIAAELNLKPGTVRQNLSLARRALSAWYSGKDNADE